MNGDVKYLGISTANNGWLIRLDHQPGSYGEMFVAETPSALAKLIFDWAVKQLPPKPDPMEEMYKSLAK